MTEEASMMKKLTKHGNSYALVIDKPVLELLRITENTPLEITTDGQSLNISPVQDEKRRKQFEAALKKTNKKFGKALKKLAE